MANIQPYLDAIMNAIYGEEVRGSIVDAISAINTESESAVSAASGYRDSALAASEDAETYKNLASGYADSASSASSTATSKAGEAHDWAIGPNGTSGTPSDTNNAKYWSEQARAIAQFDDSHYLKDDGSVAASRLTVGTIADSTTPGTNSLSVGNANNASGLYSVAEGRGTTASGTSSHASGQGTRTTADNHFVCGTYNNSSTNDELFTVGNGNSTTGSNAFGVTSDGYIRTKGRSTKIAFGVDGNGNYGYIKEGADTVTPFKNPTGTKSITTNGTHDVENYKTATVSVPTGITPSGTKYIYDNGNFDVGSYKYAQVSVQPTVSIRASEEYDYTNVTSFEHNTEYGDNVVLLLFRIPAMTSSNSNNFGYIFNTGTVTRLIWQAAYLNASGNSIVICAVRTQSYKIGVSINDYTTGDYVPFDVVGFDIGPF